MCIIQLFCDIDAFLLNTRASQTFTGYRSKKRLSENFIKVRLICVFHQSGLRHTSDMYPRMQRTSVGFSAFSHVQNPRDT